MQLELVSQFVTTQRQKDQIEELSVAIESIEQAMAALSRLG